MTKKENRHFKLAVFYLSILIGLILFLQSENVFSQGIENKTEEEKPDVALWLARSCIGEAKWNCVESTECAGLMHIYLKRSIRSNGKYTIYEIVRKYSAATKRRPDHPRKWIFDLDRTKERPARFPKNLNWKWKHKPKWKKTLKHAEAFLRGEIPDPLPEADHYGSKDDHHRAVKAGWCWLVGAGMLNRFYSTSCKVSRPK
jgi:hypothetical protein